jgi:hypothetical protein
MPLDGGAINWIDDAKSGVNYPEEEPYFVQEAAHDPRRLRKEAHVEDYQAKKQFPQLLHNTERSSPTRVVIITSSDAAAATATVTARESPVTVLPIPGAGASGGQSPLGGSSTTSLGNSMSSANNSASNNSGVQRISRVGTSQAAYRVDYTLAESHFKPLHDPKHPPPISPRGERARGRTSPRHARLHRSHADPLRETVSITGSVEPRLCYAVSELEQTQRAAVPAQGRPFAPCSPSRAKMAVATPHAESFNASDTPCVQ